MISGIRLPNAPNLNGITLNKVIADLDLLNERFPKTSFKNLRGITIDKKTYTGEKYMINMIKYEKEDSASFDSLCDLHRLISDSIPDFTRFFRLDNRTILIVYPKFKDYKVNEVFEMIMEEIQRISVFLIKTFGIERKSYIMELIQDYVNMCVEYPGKNN